VEKQRPGFSLDKEFPALIFFFKPNKPSDCSTQAINQHFYPSNVKVIYSSILTVIQFKMIAAYS